MLVSTKSRFRPAAALLLWLHIAVCCVSLIYVAEFYAYLKIIIFDSSRVYAISLVVVPFAIASLVFAITRFSFGYFLGFYFFTMILGYLWIGGSSRLRYDHTVASVSALASALAFLGPALFITSPIKQRVVLSQRAFDHFVSLLFAFAAIVIAFGAYHNFRVVGIGDIYGFRGGIEFPKWLRYAIGATLNAMLPFAFACCVMRGYRWRAVIALLLLLLLYPITLSKLALFAPVWLVFLFVLSRFFEARTTVMLSLFLPIVAGVILAMLFKSGTVSWGQMITYFSAINFRMIAIPSIALDFYNEFFSMHDRTYFCQILFLKPFVDCPYTEYLSVVMERAYGLGNLNASLFATEGIASVGPVLAPLAGFACGLVIAVANRLSAGLPSRFVVVSGGILPQVFLNVPLTTTLLTGGAAVLFVLWYITPRAMFDRTEQSVASP